MTSGGGKTGAYVLASLILLVAPSSGLAHGLLPEMDRLTAPYLDRVENRMWSLNDKLRNVLKKFRALPHSDREGTSIPIAGLLDDGGVRTVRVKGVTSTLDMAFPHASSGYDVIVPSKEGFTCSEEAIFIHNLVHVAQARSDGMYAENLDYLCWDESHELEAHSAEVAYAAHVCDPSGLSREQAGLVRASMGDDYERFRALIRSRSPDAHTVSRLAAVSLTSQDRLKDQVVDFTEVLKEILNETTLSGADPLEAAQKISAARLVSRIRIPLMQRYGSSLLDQGDRDGFLAYRAARKEYNRVARLLDERHAVLWGLLDPK